MTNSGLGDVVLRGRYYVVDGTGLVPTLAVTARLKIPTAVQLVHESGVCRKLTHGGGTQWIISADRWLNLLP